MKLNKQLIVILGIFIFTGIFWINLFNKYFLVFFHHSIYYCQEVLKSIPLRLPDNLGESVSYIFFATLSFVIIKLSSTLYKVINRQRRLNNLLVPNKKINLIAKKLILQNKILVYKDNQLTAFCLGIFDTKIYISTGLINLLSDLEVEAVLRHEKYHLDHKDTIAAFLASSTLLLLPFVPILSRIFDDFRVQNEVMADKESIARMNSSKYLISVLKKLLSHELSPVSVFATGLADPDTLEIRIKKLTLKEVKRKQFSLIGIITSLFTLIILSTLSLYPVAAIELHNQDKDLLIICSGTQKCNSSCESQIASFPYSHR